MVCASTRCLRTSLYEARIHHMTVPTAATVTRNGQISLPAALRRRWGAARVLVVDRGDYALVRPLPDDPVAELRGSIPAEGPSTEELRGEERDAERRREQTRWSSSTPTP